MGFYCVVSQFSYLLIRWRNVPERIMSFCLAMYSIISGVPGGHIISGDGDSHLATWDVRLYGICGAFQRISIYWNQGDRLGTWKKFQAWTVYVPLGDLMDTQMGMVSSS